MHKTWHVYVDGAARGNPGPAGAGIYVVDSDKKPIIEKGFFLGKKTNNQAEYLALLLALFLLKKELKKHSPTLTLLITSDSELLVKQMKGIYKVKNDRLRMLKTIAETLLENMEYRFTHVLREKNKEADALANEGIEKKNKLPIIFVNFIKKKYS